MKTLKLKCECGQEFERPAKYQEYIDKYQHNVHWRWKLKYCDACFKKRTEKALKKLPDIINLLLMDDV